MRRSVDEKEEVQLLLQGQDASSYEQWVTIPEWVKYRTKPGTLCELEMYLWEDSPIQREEGKGPSDLTT